MVSQKTILLIGATGFLGSKVAREAVTRGHDVRALVRKGTDAAWLKSLGVTLRIGDLLDQPSLLDAMSGCDAVITTAAGYTERRAGDFASAADTEGQKNLAFAAKAVGIERYVLCSILSCDRAQSVPHFWHKKLAEDALEQAGVPFVALRPGAFIDQGGGDFWQAGIVKGKLPFLANPTAKATFVHPDDVASYLVAALDIDTVEQSLRIDIGADRPVSVNDIAAIISRQLGRTIKASVPPWPLVSAGLGVVGVFKPQLHDLKQMLAYIQTGTYLADIRQQQSFFGEVPTVEEGIRTYLVSRGI